MTNTIEKTPGRKPATYADILALAKAADVVDWARDNQGLRITIDDKAADRRTVIEVKTLGGKCGVAYLKTLKGFDAERNRWAEYCAPSATLEMPDRRGWKALRDWIRERAVTTTGFPNPAFLFLYKDRV